jgi:hypothetical protein
MLGAVATSVAWLWPSRKPHFPIVWRIWIFGFSGGFVLLSLAIVGRIYGGGLLVAASPSFTISMILSAVMLFSPLLAIALGMLGGGWLGIRLARRRRDMESINT